MKRSLFALSLAVCLIASVAASAAEAVSGLPALPTSTDVEILPDSSIITFTLNTNDEPPAALHGLVAVPPGTAHFELQLVSGSAAEISSPTGLQILRGQPVVSVLVTEPGPEEVAVAVRHDGSWFAKSDRSQRLISSALHGVLGQPIPDDGTKSTIWPGGSYVIVSDPEFEAAAQVLADWKMRKGFPATVVTTATTGVTRDAIKAWLQDAYDNWDNPPEYVTLVGDVDQIPTFEISENVTDLPYSLLDGDDWLPDVMLGRISVESSYEAETVVNKIVGYERTPFVEPNNEWFINSLMVAGLNAETPTHTVQFCGEQLETIGFNPAEPIYSPPLPPGDTWQTINSIIDGNVLDGGVSMLVYRGWAYGAAGWDPPLYTVDDIPHLDNGAQLPVVMSFVCLNGNYDNGGVPCFGEAFLRHGTPTEPKGAVSFIGNGEHWSHTRYNDAIAIAHFERITDPGITDLGSLLAAGKIRMLDYFPSQIEAESEDDELSVEFYFHIYNLLGDPELNFWKQMPTELSVSHATQVSVGANYLLVEVDEANGTTPLAGARVGVVQDGQLLGCGYSDAAGQAGVPLLGVVSGSDVEITVTCPGRLPYEGTATTATAEVYTTVSAVVVDDDADGASDGNADGVVNPGEAIELLVTMQNSGTDPSGIFDAALAVTGPASVTHASVTDIASIDGGTTGAATESFVISVADDAIDGAIVSGEVTADPGGRDDLSQFQLTVSAPNLVFTPVFAGDGFADPGETVGFDLSIVNNGSAGTAGGDITVSASTAGVTIDDGDGSFAALAAGAQTITTDASFTLSLDATMPVGKGVELTVAVTTQEGYTGGTICSLIVGNVNITAPVGPDAYGYYAYDSADLNYPANRPQYVWTELSTNLGGIGTEIEWNRPDNDAFRLGYPIPDPITIALPFPFTFYGQTYNQLQVRDNGVVSFETENQVNFYNWTIPSEHGLDALIAPFWDNLTPPGVWDLNGDPVGLDSDGMFSYHDVDGSKFIIEWSRMRHYLSEITDLQSFQMVLFDPSVAEYETPTGDGIMEFHYRQVRNNDHERMYATVGIESPDGTDGLQLTYGNVYTDGMAPLGPGLAVRITTEEPVHVPYTLATFSAKAATGGIQLDWAPIDERPVNGWQVYRLVDGAKVPVTRQALPGSSRGFLDPEGSLDEDHEYVILATHPYGVRSELGSFTYRASETGITRVALYPTFPNPAQGSAQIGFALPRAGNARLRIYDLAGRCVRTLLDGPVPSGPSLQIWDGRDQRGHLVADGVYLYRLEADRETLTRKLLLVR